MILILCSVGVWAQDIHFSQFYSSPMQTNPANFGNYDGNYRIVLNNKNQWNSFTKAYRTFAFSFDYATQNLFMKDSEAGIGVVLNEDIAGDGKFGTTQILVGAAYGFPFLEKKLLVAVGALCGYSHHNININNLNFGSQYVNDGFDSNIDSGEDWENSSFGYFDCGVGLNAKLKLKPHYDIAVGTSIYHLNMPRKTFLGDSDSRLPVKWTAYATLNYQVSEKIWVSPMFFSMYQQKYMEFDIGAIARYDHNPLNLQAIYFGIFARTSDAGILCAGLQYHNVRFIVNYDINLSKLSKISRGNGGVEFSLICILAKPKLTEVPYYRKCPDFM